MKKSASALAATLIATVAITGCGGNRQQQQPQQQIDDVDYAQYCADHLTNTVAPIQACQVPNPRYQIAYADIGHHVWNHDYDTTPDYAFVPVGRPLPVVTYVQPYNYAYRRPLVYSSTPVHRAVSVPYTQYVKTAPRIPAPPAKPAPAPAAAVKAPNPGIQRGGFGVPSAPRFTAPPAAPSFSGRSSSPSSFSSVRNK